MISNTASQAAKSYLTDFRIYKRGVGPDSKRGKGFQTGDIPLET